MTALRRITKITLIALGAAAIPLVAVLAQGGGSTPLPGNTGSRTEEGLNQPESPVEKPQGPKPHVPIQVTEK